MCIGAVCASADRQDISSWVHCRQAKLADIAGEQWHPTPQTTDVIVVSWTLVRQTSSPMRVMNHNCSATKQHLHPQSVAEINCHSVFSRDRIRKCDTSSGSHHKDTGQSPFPSAGTAVSLFRAKMVQQRPLLPREVETRLPDCGVTH